MEESDQKEKKRKGGAEIKIVPVPSALGEIKNNISISSNIENKPSKKQIINQAFKFHSEGNIQEATKYYQLFIDEGFKDFRVFSNYGVILKNHGYLHEAEISYRKAIDLNPHYAPAHSNLGNILIDIGKLDEAELFIRKAIKLKPDLANAHYNLGLIFRDLGKLKEAEISYQKAIELKPNHYDACFNLGWLQLLRGEYQSGLENYEFRFKIKKAITHANTKLKQINNKKLKKGEKILVVSEQGFGDTLQYMRYVPYLKTLGLDISFCAQRKLHSLIKSSKIDSSPLTPEEASEVLEGKWIPLLSLPKYLKVSPNNPIISEPYIFPTKELKKKWENILSKEKRPIIGINWQGNPNIENQTPLQGRSLPLETFSTLAKNKNYNFLSLQKGFGSEQLDHCSFKNKFVECQPQVDVTWDFLENAAIIENCDLIITSDTSIAHLAGGIGKSTWLLLNHFPEWRWGIEGKSTFWYPSMRLFRQKERHNWGEMMERVSNQLNIRYGSKICN